MKALLDEELDLELEFESSNLLVLLLSKVFNSFIIVNGSCTFDIGDVGGEDGSGGGM